MEPRCSKTFGYAVSEELVKNLPATTNNLDSLSDIPTQESSEPVASQNNKSANAMTYPHGTAYHLDISRLLRILALGVPPPVPTCRSLISTAIIRGFNSSQEQPNCAQGTGSVPDIKQLIVSQDGKDKRLTTPKGLFKLIAFNFYFSAIPQSPEDIMVPSAPCVNDMHPLETLHNSLTLAQLENFLLYQVPLD
ncbi:hypothetical protein Ciccas_002643 [Cichlidogyrus casuarinus]|uniref:Uncharacterized protein n=1 Tax=Cichlidogyrus casuarinus TaxID=1844966 RepID=A0ABD2QGN0_9PLAT